MNRSKFIFIVLLLTLVIPLYFFIDRSDEEAPSELIVYCAAGMRIPMERVAREYEDTFKVDIRLQFAGSGTLLGNIEASKIGDLYLAADTSYIEIARQKGLLTESIPVCSLMAGLIVKGGNP
ncbi:MAG: substrate-binding domain-containing protein, partial [Verrucomicrobiota bacterium]|nr:substrate-binding domain-containing protein [Verrucomicrobiota bacterium]